MSARSRLVLLALVPLGCGSSQGAGPAPTPTSDRPADPPVLSQAAPDAGVTEPTPPPPESPDAAPASEGDAAPSDPLAEERAAYERAAPVFERHCFVCHTKAGARATRSALHHVRMDSYPFGGHHADELAAIVRQVLGATGERPTMPRNDPGSVRGEDLAAVLAWADAFDRAQAAGLHAGEEHGGRHNH